MFGDHATFIIPAYGVSAFVIIALIVWLRLQYSARLKELAKLESSGISRRSSKRDTSKLHRGGSST